MIPYAPMFTLNNGKRVFFGEILSHDAFLRVLKAYIRWRADETAITWWQRYEREES